MDYEVTDTVKEKWIICRLSVAIIIETAIGKFIENLCPDATNTENVLT